MVNDISKIIKKCWTHARNIFRGEILQLNVLENDNRLKMTGWKIYFKWQFIPFIDTQEVIYKELMNKELRININILYINIKTLQRITILQFKRWENLIGSYCKIENKLSMIF